MKKPPVQNADIRGHKRAKPGKSGPNRTSPNGDFPGPPDPTPRDPTQLDLAAADPAAPPDSPSPLDTAASPGESPTPDDTRQLTFNQQRAIVALIECPTIAAAARQTGVNERTIRRWLDDSLDFQDELREMRQQYLVHAATRLQSTASRAVQTLLDLLASKDHIESGRATLVRTALDFAFRSGAYTDLADRLDGLEEAAKDTPAKEPEPIFDRSLLEDEESEAA